MLQNTVNYARCDISKASINFITQDSQITYIY